VVDRFVSCVDTEIKKGGPGYTRDSNANFRELDLLAVARRVQAIRPTKNNVLPEEDAARLS
jgi:hypothetical protein